MILVKIEGSNEKELLKLETCSSKDNNKKCKDDNSLLK